jgi:hypothetical protein
MIRERSNNNSVHTTTLGDDYRLNIDKITWKVPHILLNDNERLKLKLYQTIQSARPLQMSLRSWDLYKYPNMYIKISSQYLACKDYQSAGEA